MPRRQMAMRRASVTNCAVMVAHHIDFPDYSNDELLAIAETMLKNQNYSLSPDASRPARSTPCSWHQSSSSLCPICVLVNRSTLLRLAMAQSGPCEVTGLRSCSETGTTVQGAAECAAKHQSPASCMACT